MAGRHRKQPARPRKQPARPRFGFSVAAAALMAGGALCINAYGASPATYVPLALTPSQAGPPLSRVQAVFTNSLVIHPATDQMSLISQAKQQVVQPVVHVEKTRTGTTHAARRSTHGRSEPGGRSGHSASHRRSGAGESHSERGHSSRGNSSHSGGGRHRSDGSGGHSGGHSSGRHHAGDGHNGGYSGGSSGGSGGGDSGSSGGTANA